MAKKYKWKKGPRGGLYRWHEVQYLPYKKKVKVYKRKKGFEKYIR